MASLLRKNAPRAAAEISLVHLKNCLVNLPPSLVSVLVNVNTPAQNVIVELSPSPTQRSIYLGWTGLPSKRPPSTPNVSTTPLPLVEVDATLASLLSLSPSQPITATIHLDPPVAHTVNIEPLTPDDWEVIELHATFLELNLLSQIRALPNPKHASSKGGYPLALHLSPTTTANFRVVSLEPVPDLSVPFVKIAADAEVIVAPKARKQAVRTGRESRSVGGASRRSGKSSASTVRRRSAREEKKPLFLRGVERNICKDRFDEGEDEDECGLAVWVDADILVKSEFKKFAHVVVSVVRPATVAAATPVAPAAMPAGDAQKQAQETPANPDGAKAVAPATKVLVHLRPWHDAPDSQTVALSIAVCSTLGCEGLVGGVIKLEPAPAPLSSSAVKSIKIFPFATPDAKTPDGLKFGGESRAGKDEAVKRIWQTYRQVWLKNPVTDSMVLPVSGHGLHGWDGGILKFDPPPPQSPSSQSTTTSWLASVQKQDLLDLQPPVPRPAHLDEKSYGPGHPDPDTLLVGIDTLLDQMQTHLAHMSSVLLTGAQGAGKTAVVRYLALHLREKHLFHTTYFPCRRLLSDETRQAAIKDTLARLFMNAAWGARLGGRALVVLDDLDKLCPVETELQVGNDNGRSRVLSEAVCAMVRQYCGRGSGVVLLATAQGKDALNSVVVGGHVVQEIVKLRAPDKEARRRIVEAVVKQQTLSPASAEMEKPASRPPTADGSVAATEDWMDGGAGSGTLSKHANHEDGFSIEPDLDFLDIAGLTDGYMPGDLLLLVARARNEALIRAVALLSSHSNDAKIQFGKTDFTSALRGFTPASLRTVTLQTSTVSFASIGGLSQTRATILETLQYPTKYAPIFSSCPLRLRSGLLLYGYPGCGKTLLASAVASECGLNFISVKGPEILNKYIGASEKSVRDLFERAQAAKPAVLFFDEFDSIAPRRGHDSTGVTDRVVNQLLTLMDGAEGLSGVYVLAATSRPDLIDPALLRPGRLDKSLLCGLPDAEERADILAKMLDGANVGGGVRGVLPDLVKGTEGCSGADLAALVGNAQLGAIQAFLAGKEGLAGAGSTAGGKKAKGRVAAFVKFRYGGGDGDRDGDGDGDGDKEEAGGYNRAREIRENSEVLAKLAEIRNARRRARKRDPVRDQGDERAGDGKAGGGGQGGNDEARIEAGHLLDALRETRPSISARERARLGRIYAEFVGSRSGEMRDGQASTEVGGRSSLM